MVGWLVCMIAMGMTVYDGLGSMVFQSLIAMICSGLAMIVALLVGLVLKIPVLGKFWSTTCWPAMVLIAGSLFVLCLGTRLGWQQTYMLPEFQRQYEGLRTEAMLGGYFVLVFAIAHWPINRHFQLIEQ